MSRKKNIGWTIIMIVLAVVIVAVMAMVAGTVQAGNNEGKTPRPLAALPPGPHPGPWDNPTTPEKAKLGELLFFDQRLSGDGSTPCVKCHDPKFGWGTSDDLSIGYPGTQHFRNSHTVLNTGHLKKLFWEGRSTSLEAQAGGAAFGQSAGNLQGDIGEARMRQVPEYREMFMKVFGELPTWDNAARAIAAFQRTLNSDPKVVPFDRYMNGDKSAMTSQQVKGMELFKGKANCIACHDGMMFTDEDQHNLCLPRNPAFDDDPLRQIELRFRMKTAGITNHYEVDEDLGLYMQTHRTQDIMRFRTEKLRESKHTPPYMHNGVFSTLEEVVDFFNKGGEDQANCKGVKDPLMKPLNLTDQEKKDLVAFLEALSSPEMPFKDINPVLPKDGIVTKDKKVVPLPAKGADAGATPARTVVAGNTGSSAK
jgi:cytochrome c peroxidase